jgi:hypothetical protein
MINITIDDMSKLTKADYKKFIEGEIWQVGNMVTDAMYKLSAGDKTQDEYDRHSLEMIEPVSRLIMLWQVVKNVNNGKTFGEALKIGVDEANRNEKIAEEMTDEEYIALKERIEENKDVN